MRSSHVVEVRTLAHAGFFSSLPRLSTTMMGLPVIRTLVMTFRVSSSPSGGLIIAASLAVAIWQTTSVSSEAPVPGVGLSITASGVGPVYAGRSIGVMVSGGMFAG